jgi:hypothetical protein
MKPITTSAPATARQFGQRRDQRRVDMIGDRARRPMGMVLVRKNAQRAGFQMVGDAGHDQRHKNRRSDDPRPLRFRKFGHRRQFAPEPPGQHRDHKMRDRGNRPAPAGSTTNSNSARVPGANSPGCPRST